MKILGFYSSGKPKIEELLNGSLFWSEVSTLLSFFFFHLWMSAIEIEVLNVKDCFTKHAVLQFPPKTHSFIHCPEKANFTNFENSSKINDNIFVVLIQKMKRLI